MSKDKQTLPIQNLVIKIGDDSRIPHVILNGIDFQKENVLLKSMRIIWVSKEDEVPETLIQVDYAQFDGNSTFRETSVSQSFPNSLLSK